MCTYTRIIPEIFSVSASAFLLGTCFLLLSGCTLVFCFSFCPTSSFSCICFLFCVSCFCQLVPFHLQPFFSSLLVAQVLLVPFLHALPSDILFSPLLPSFSFSSICCIIRKRIYMYTRLLQSMNVLTQKNHR